MKIALCFYGYFGDTNMTYKRPNRLNGYKLKDLKKEWGVNHFNKFVIQNYDIDIFIHTWDNIKDEDHKYMMESYKPKKILIENQNTVNVAKNMDRLKIGWSKQTQSHRLWMLWYTRSKSVDLMLEYQKENNFEYDLVMTSGFEILFFKPIEFTKLNRNFLYTSHENETQKWRDYYKEHDMLYDGWYITNPKNLKLFTDWKTIEKYFEQIILKGEIVNNHKVTYAAIKNCNLQNKLNFYLYPKYEFLKSTHIFLDQYKHLLKDVIY